MGLASFALDPKNSFFFISPLFTFKVERYTKEKNDLMGFQTSVHSTTKNRLVLESRRF
jgi:hypothetical protein